MVSTKSVTAASEESSKLAIVDLTADVKALRVEMSQLKQQQETLKHAHSHCNQAKRERQHSLEWPKQDLGREKYRSLRQASPNGYTFASRSQNHASLP